MYKLILIAAFIAFAISLSAQTTAEEYDYLTKTYKEDIAKGSGLKKGYELKHINCIYGAKSYVDVFVFYRTDRTKKEKAAYMLVYKNPNLDSEYFCYPNPMSESVIIEKYEQQLNDNPISDPVKKRLVSLAVEAIVYWPKNQKDTSENFITKPILSSNHNEWKKYLDKNLNNKIPKINGAPPGTYNVDVSYTIDEKGMMLNAFANNNPKYGTAEEAERVVRQSPRLFPALQEGKPIMYNGNHKITFVVADTAKYTDYDKIFTNEEVDKEAEFTGGKKEFQRYLVKNLNSTLPSDKGALDGKYTVLCSFIVGKDGTISNVVAENNPGYGTANEAVRVLKKQPNWQPALLNGQQVKCSIKQGITFVVSR